MTIRIEPNFAAKFTSFLEYEENHDSLALIWSHVTYINDVGRGGIDKLYRDGKCQLWDDIQGQTIYLLQSSEDIWAFVSIDTQGSTAAHELFMEWDVSKIEYELRLRLTRVV